jgi:hypothetical protein
MAVGRQDIAYQNCFCECGRTHAHRHTKQKHEQSQNNMKYLKQLQQNDKEMVLLKMR